MEYHELEAAREFHYSVGEWQRESPMNRARAVAHILHRNLREGYQAEEAMDKSGNKGPGTSNVSYADAMRGMLGII